MKPNECIAIVGKSTDFDLTSEQRDVDSSLGHSFGIPAIYMPPENHRTSNYNTCDLGRSADTVFLSDDNETTATCTTTDKG